MNCPICGAEQMSGKAECSGCGAVLPVRTFFGPALLLTFFWFPPLGMVALVYSVKTRRLLKQGRFSNAADSSRKTKRWCRAAFFTGLIWGVFYLSRVIAGGFSHY